MKILMLGWEFPPFIAGGLGTACYGLTRAINARGIDVLFVLPRPVAGTGAPARLSLADPQYDFPHAHGAAQDAQDHGVGFDPTGATPVEPAPAPADVPPTTSPPSAATTPPAPTAPAPAALPEISPPYRVEAFPHVTFRRIDVLLSPYWNATTYDQEIAWQARHTAQAAAASAPAGAPSAGNVPSPAPTAPEPPAPAPPAPPPPPAKIASMLKPPLTSYAANLISETDRYARLVESLAGTESFDVIHAHDWMTFRAGIAAAERSGKPLIVHVHSTEFDRNGRTPDPQVVAIEQAGVLAATRVIAVSNMTKRMLVAHYGADPEKVDVVHNAVELPAAEQTAQRLNLAREEKVVLFLGRITAQKGPEYFLAAARKVLDVHPAVKFIMAGAGDMVHPIIELAAAMGIGHKVLFTGFLSSQDVQRVFQMADLYVMPSVSEPFGIAPLEALSHDVPVIISRQSGAAEVLNHVLKVDFWDVDDLANKILAVLRHPVLAQSLRRAGKQEVTHLTWQTAAGKVADVYEQLTTRPASARPPAELPGHELPKRIAPATNHPTPL